MSMMNRMGNAKNEFQGKTKKVLCVCSAGLLRSPTVAVVLASEPFGFNTRAAGVSQEYALVPIDAALVHWADEIVCMEKAHKVEVDRLIKNGGLEPKPVTVLDLPDHFKYRDPDLMRLAAERYQQRSDALR